MKILYYFTIGYNKSYVDCLHLAVKSLRHYSKDSDIVVLTDVDLYYKVKCVLPSDVIVYAYSQSSTPETASMRKLQIFEKNIVSYDVVIFIDSDIIIHTEIDRFAELISVSSGDNDLCVYSESRDISWHKQLYFSLNQYTEEDIQYFSENKIHVFNAGLFGFKPTKAIMEDFAKIQDMIVNHKGPFFYEQSFMNVYYNRKNNTNREVFTDDHYKMRPLDDTNYENKIIHFCGSASDGQSKFTWMKQYVDKYMPFLDSSCITCSP